MSDMLPLRIAGKPLPAPKPPPVGPRHARPVWTDYRPKVPVECDYCVQIAYDTAMEGRPFPGIRTARRKRTRNGQSVYLCAEHARKQEEKDHRDYAGVAKEGKGRSGQRFIA